MAVRSFPHLKDTNFPNVNNVNVYEYQNDFDYSKFAQSQMRIRLMSVPWDLGEVHVGLKSVPMGNVVHFETDEERDKWLDAQPCEEWVTRYRAYHAEDEIKLPMPFEQIALYNYLVIDYEESPVTIPGKKSIKRWLYFIRDIKMESINSTVCTIKRDSWQMFINDVEVSYLQLERGHAPMFAAATPEEYLKAPIKNTKGLLAEDANFGVATLTNNVSRFVPNEGEQVLVFCCYANVNTGDWGSKADNDWCIPRQTYKTKNGAIASHVFAVDVDKAGEFLTNADSDLPQFIQTIQACFTVAKSLVTLGDTFTFCGAKCYPCAGSAALNEIELPTVEQFGYSAGIKNVTKLYTAPYAHLELTDEQGNVSVVNIEDCSGSTLQIRTSLSLALPWLKLDAQINGVGSAESNHLTFKNLADHKMTFGGHWYDLLRSWEIPCYLIQQGNNKTNDYRTHYDRLANTEVAAANADMTTTNADTNATAATKVAAENADALKDNTATQNKASSAITAENVDTASYDTTLSNKLNTSTQAWNAGMARDLANNETDASKQSAGIGISGNVLSSAAAGAGIGLAGGGTVGSIIPGAGTAAGAAVGAIGGALVGACAGVVSGMQTGVAINATEAQAEIQINNSKEILSATNKNNTQRTDNQNDASTNNTATQNTANTTQAARSASAITTTQGYLSSAARTTAAKTASTTKEIASIQNARQKDQAHILAPNVFGRSTASDNVTRPQGLWLNVCTQPQDAINQAANEFLRYGYRYNQQWQFKTWDVGERFTYWKASDLWLLAKNLPDAFVDEIRNYLLQGVTIWRKPEYINATSIYENGI